MPSDVSEKGVSRNRADRFDHVRTIAGGSLTRREQEIVRLLLSGETNRGIAADLGVSEHTVKVQLGRLYAKAGVTSRLQLVLRVMRRG
jgi:DNA-binding NarL/FixJ family response regulator